MGWGRIRAAASPTCALHGRAGAAAGHGHSCNDGRVHGCCSLCLGMALGPVSCLQNHRTMSAGAGGGNGRSTL